MSSMLQFGNSLFPYYSLQLKRLLPTKEALVERIKLLEAEINKSKK